MPPLAQLAIAQPCAASWAAMTPAPAGRHCAACQKTVVDFTSQPDAAILTYFRQAPSGDTCGRFRREQLGRPLVAGSRRPVAWLAGLLLAALGATGCQPALPGPQVPSEAPEQVLLAVDSTTVSVDSADVSEPDYLMGDIEKLQPKQ